MKTYKNHDPNRGKRIKEALSARLCNKQLALAKELGIHECTICRWQQGKSISLKHAVLLCEKLDISMDWLILGRGEMNFHHNGKKGQNFQKVDFKDVDEFRKLPEDIYQALMSLLKEIAKRL
ncbi:hypothetical protein A7Q09_10635 [Methylacidiphilum sp. Yel]|jgi:transcriptional regulator with XRE-family HTH domain|uniref:helix-turn-helix domain-containing protein n=1 Tax=Methylacidiphilum sp. Yel TaxID=1847730 RepID=UPI00106B60DB|nr:helix-turn-helix domain-containing protein [Methylacidiphilum sp. Yel]TFE65931.1 hypothetical protein A7Q09_10635 [Methylacidiphilum sp. Yel]